VLEIVAAIEIEFGAEIAPSALVSAVRGTWPASSVVRGLVGWARVGSFIRHHEACVLAGNVVHGTLNTFNKFFYFKFYCSPAPHKTLIGTSARKW